MSGHLAAIAALALLGATAPGERWVVSEKPALELLAGPRTLRARLVSDVLLGPRVELRREAGGLKGSLLGAQVLLSCDRRGVVGHVGTVEANLTVERTRDGLRASGTFAGHGSELRMGPRGIRGRLGGCTYTLEPTSSGYLGFRICGGPVSPVPTSLTLPLGFAALPIGEQVALLALVLSSQESIEALPGGEP